MFNKRINTAVSLSVLTLLLNVCELAAQPKPLIANRYADNGDGTVTDIRTNLTWQRCSVGQTWAGETCTGKVSSFKWNDAMKLAKDGWRLPTVDELDTLVQCPSGRTPSVRPSGAYVRETDGICDGKEYKNPKININAFPNTPANEFWSSSPLASNSEGAAWAVHFGAGFVGLGIKNADSMTYRVRLVRD